VESCLGLADAEARGVTRTLGNGAEVFVGDLVSTHEAARLVMLLGVATRIHMGGNVRMGIDKYLAETRGELHFDSGPVLLDRDEGAPPTDLRLRSPFGTIALRGTRFFAGPSKGVFGVFVQRGIVDFTAGGETVRLTAGEGSDVRRPGGKPTPPNRWGSERAVDALASVY
jgi:ferric-dicitrate binding protein FerR (iron transport regulator)